MSAISFLQKNGYEVLFHRQKTPYGEIDIVAKLNGVISFVEVKSADSVDQAFQNIDKRQIKRIIDAAQYMIGANMIDSNEFSFDVIAVSPSEIKILRNAFCE